MSTPTYILWGINRPDGSSVTESPTFGSAFWTSKDGQYGFPDGHQDAAHRGAQELTDRLIRCGVRPDAAKHDVVRVVIETKVTREIDWPTPTTPASSDADREKE